MDNWTPARGFAPSKPDMYAPQRRCPNCGSERVTGTLRQYDRKRGRFISSDVRQVRIWGLLTWFVTTVILYGVIPALFGSRSAISVAIPFWVPAALGAAVFIVTSARHEWRITHSVRVESYTCGQCGHKWTLHDGRPLPADAKSG